MQLTLLLATATLLSCVVAFEFRSVQVTPDSRVINTVTRYRFAFDRTTNDASDSTAYLSVPVLSTDTLTVTFPITYTLTNVTCTVSVNGGTQFVPGNCVVSGWRVIASGIVNSSTVVSSVVLWVSNVLNPSPAFMTDYFYGTIGGDTSGAGNQNSNSNVQLQAGLFQSCTVSFTPNTVNSTADMIVTLVPTNRIGSTGSVLIRMPPTRRWTGDISSSNFMPIAPSMPCSNRSTNVRSTFQCIGSVIDATITASSMFDAAIDGSFSFAVSNFLSPPSDQPLDANSINITSLINGSAIDSCVTFVSTLAPKALIGLNIINPLGGVFIVNRQTSLRFTFTITDTLAPADLIIINFPAGSSFTVNNAVTSSSNSTLSRNASYDSDTRNLALFFNQSNNINSGTFITFTVGSYTAPPSTEPTADFTLTFFRGGYAYRKMSGTTTLTASPSSISGTVGLGVSTVNAVTTYTFVIVMTDPISSAGRIKIVLPVAVTSTSATPIATVTGSVGGLAGAPTTAYNSVENSITFTRLNSSTSSIAAQTITIVVNGIKNPSSTAPTSAFSIFTYLRQTDSSLVSIGSVPAISATTVAIDPSRVVLTPSSVIVNDQSTTYSLQLTVVNPIPAGGFFTLYVPPQIGLVPSSVAGRCSININSTSFVPTTCTGISNGSGNLINFTNPFISDATANTVFVARVSSVFSNPSSTRQTSSFGLYTFHSNGFSIASIDNSIFAAMTTADTFQSTSIARSSETNFQLNTYTFSLSQRSQMQASSVLVISFPANTVASSNSTCTMIAPVSQNLSCAYSNLVMNITLPAVAFSSGTNIVVAVNNVRNPASFASTGAFSFQTRLAADAGVYSSGLVAPNLTNSIATSFEGLTYQFTPAVYGAPVSLRVTFDPSNSGVLPSSLRLSFASTFTVQNITCSSFIDFTGTCSTVLPSTIQVTGTFTSSPMSFTVSGITSPLMAPADFSPLVTFDSAGFKLDEALSTILFVAGCTLPCQTCVAGQPGQCLSCYSNTAISRAIYLDSALRGCYENCVDGKFENVLTSQCQSCDTNCLTCDGSASFCMTCNTSTTFKFILANSSEGTQRCVATCPVNLYPEMTQIPVACRNCIQPCLACTTATSCSSCINGTFFISNQCLSSCPNGTHVQNPTTNNCDPCSISCLTCAGSVSTCTSCNGSLLLYLGVCRNDCPAPLVPQNGTCGPCSSNCKTCVNDPFTCTSCETGSGFPYLLNSRCLPTCPQTFFNNISGGVCTPCSSVAGLNCRNCSSSSTCRTCDTSFVFYLQTCIDYVPAGFVNVSGIAQACINGCATCQVTVSNCTTCTTLNLYDNQCILNCPTGFIALSRVCEACISPCRTCQTARTTCTSCLTTLSPSVFLSNAECLESCPDGTYPTRVNFTCADCKSPCQFCESLTLCRTCLNGFFLEGTNCVTTCQAGFTGVNRTCVPCSGNCATCENSPSICRTCKPDTYLLQANKSCVASCGTGLFIDFLNRICVACTTPCRTCVNSTDTCLSCDSGVLFNNQCLDKCPEKYFLQNGQCISCPANCSSCESLINCTGCVQALVIFNGFCIGSCPATDAVVVDSRCTKCSTLNCHRCTSADFCINCNSNYSLLNGQCLGQCPAGFQTNGTHCLDTNEEALTASTNFPVPFSIAGIVIIIACLMSKLQFNHTFMPGAIYGFVSVAEVGALGYFLYLYFINFYSLTPLPFWVGVAAVAYIYVLNILAVFIQNVFLCDDKQFKSWYQARINKVTAVLVNIVSVAICHKFRNILFCKLFNFGIFTAQLDTTAKFKVINVFSFLSLLHSGAAIFAAAAAIGSVEPNTQLFYSCIDVITLTALNIVVGFFSIRKGKDFFYERTPDGFELKKRIYDGDYIESKIEPAGKVTENGQGYAANVYHVQAGTGITNKPINGKEEYFSYDQDFSLGSLVDPHAEEVAIQALEHIDEKQRRAQEPQPSEEEEKNNDRFSVAFPKTGYLFNVGSAQLEPGVSVQSEQILVKNNSAGQKFYNQEAVLQSRERSPNRTVFFKDGLNKTVSLELRTQSIKKQPKADARQSIYDNSSISESRSQSKRNILYKPNLTSRFSKTLQQTSEVQYRQPHSEPEPSMSQAKNVGVGRVRPLGEVQASEDRAGEQGYGNFEEELSEQPVARVIFEEEPTTTDVEKDRRGKMDKQKITKLSQDQIARHQKQMEERIREKSEANNRIRHQIQEGQKFNSSLVRTHSPVEAGKLYRKKNSAAIKIVEQEEETEVIQEQIPEMGTTTGAVKQQEEDIVIEQEPDLLYEEEEIEIGQGQGQKDNNEQVIQTRREQNQAALLRPEDQLNLITELVQPARQGPTIVTLDQIDRSIPEDNDHIDERPAGSLTQARQSNLPPEHGSEGGFGRGKQPGEYSHREQELKGRYEVQPIGTKESRPQTGVEHGRKAPQKATVKFPRQFEFQNESKNISESGDDDRARPLLRGPQLVVPFQTDRQETEFTTNQSKPPGRVMIARPYNTIPERSSQPLPRSIPKGPADYQQNAQFEDRSSSRERSPVARINRQLSGQKQPKGEAKSVSQSQFDEISEDPASQYRQQALIEQMAERPDDDQLRRYYEQSSGKKQRSRSKPNRKPSESQLHAQKIYMQRQDTKKWK